MEVIAAKVASFISGNKQSSESIKKTNIIALDSVQKKSNELVLFNLSR